MSTAGDLYGLMQLTYAVRVPHVQSDDDDGYADMPSSGGLPDDVRKVIEELFGKLFAHSGYEPVPVTGPSVSPMELPHTCLGKPSRHDPAPMQDRFSDPTHPLPACLVWPECHPSKPSWTPYLRIQRPYAGKDGELLPSGTAWDKTDYVVRRSGGDVPPDSQDLEASDVLEDLQLFFAQLFAQRKQAIFAPSLSERVYHVWLPPATLIPAESPDAQGAEAGWGPLAFLPYVSFVRQPMRSRFRETLTMSFVLVPVELDDSRNPGPRPFPAQEVARLTLATGGSSTLIPDAAAVKQFAILGPLVPYLQAVSQGGERPLSRALFDSSCPELIDAEHGSRPAGTLRQWVERVTCVGVERGVENPAPRWQAWELADEVLTALRMTATWSVSLSSTELEPLSHWREEVEGASTTLGPAALPLEVGDLLTRLRSYWGSPAEPPAGYAGLPPVDKPTFRGLFTRVDDSSTVGDDHMIWHVPGRRGVVGIKSRRSEWFPANSLLTHFGFLSYMMTGAASAIDIMETLGREATKEQTTLDRALTAHGLMLELEEVFDLNIAWEAYRGQWRRLRSLMGLEARYARAIQGADQLSRYEVVRETQKEQKVRDDVAAVATAFAFVIVLLTVGVLVLTGAVFVEGVTSTSGWILAAIGFASGFASIAGIGVLCVYYWRHRQKMLSSARRGASRLRSSRRSR